ncbi:indolepyruvate ferredoxin oxidoreductase, alpha subunit [Desulfosporosinus acidiphilus SJ4]|uniref:Indolepyruvate oxidoreductase subunit IorA n=1 Tax=Desulfosporosinus acidiphilus (strain DSM 22704 / JCM 16185 / SJ4) TaxID=646529 RepID=I4D106_DESAJ|nr:indolepyruvate ferredoxin oxidoreductase subunit alpha [Desulfosporosinus acidiphilus]AFM39480.1 indolepyruvate ferredoxin oxidoreductase, alpha subunit [Desulfosporosinus acidiphilus SJ4]
MALELLMGNQAIALGAIRSGVGVVTGYPGTPSTEILETVAKRNPGIYVEWSVNEKSALEVAAGAAFAGLRTMVTMKQVGLNVASDPLMSLAYLGVKGGMVIVVADDPGPISSQTEQDTRHFGIFAKLPVFDPSSPEEAYLMIGDAFEYSEKYNTPVLFRPTTRVCHGYAAVNLEEKRCEVRTEGFIKDPKWAIFPRLSYLNHLKIEERHPQLSEDFSSYQFNTVRGSGKKGIAAGGISYAYTCEALAQLNKECKLFRVATPHPFPEKLALEFLQGLEEVLVVEELDPVIEKELIYLCGKYHLPVKINGKLTQHIPKAGENSVESVTAAVGEFLNVPPTMAASLVTPPENIPVLPIRPPVLCAGCPHRASFYAVKQAMKGRKAVFSGDIGCYTLGNAKPLEMVDTCLCMGAGITIAQGLHRAEPDTVNFAFIGDSTFFHTGIPGVINAVYNETDIVLIILDNSTTAMTGHQPHPGTGKTMMGNISEKISITEVLKALGVNYLVTMDPFDLKASIAAVKEASSNKGVSAIIFKSPCIAVTEPAPLYTVDPDKCTGCRLCIKELGCPAIVKEKDKVHIESSLCYGCSICAQVCPFKAIGGANE